MKPNGTKRSRRGADAMRSEFVLSELLALSSYVSYVKEGFCRQKFFTILREHRILVRF
jgi:hypothetical protein